MSRRFALVVSCVFAIGACTSQEAAPLQTLPSPTTSVVVSSSLPTTTSVPADEPPVTEAPVDTTAGTDPEATEEPTTTTSTLPPASTTTTPPPSGNPTGTTVEYFAGSDEDGWLFVGSWTGAAYQPAVTGETIDEATIADGATPLLHELDIEPIDGAVSGTADACLDGRTGPVITPNARAPEDPGFGFRSLAFEADWTTRPRRVETVDATVASYVTAGVAAFDDVDIDASGGSISQLVVADLDGDNDDESVVVFDGEGFSAVLIIDTDTGASVTAVRSVQSGGVGTVGSGDEAAAPEVSPNADHRVLDVVDVNGDGLMEVVTHAFETTPVRTSDISIIAYDGTEVETVLTATC